MPAGLHVLHSNRLELLAGSLAQLLKNPAHRPLQKPLVPEIIIVQSKGMQRWLSLTIARSTGICAHIDFPFPNRFLVQLWPYLNDQIPDTHAFERGPMTMALMRLLTEKQDLPEFAPVRAYLRNDDSQLKLYQLARRLADTFDQYLVFRPDLIRQWEKGHRPGPDAHRDLKWQAIVWQHLCQQLSGEHHARVQQHLLRHIRRIDQLPATAPQRFFVFGVSYLPSFHLEVLSSLSQLAPVFLFILDPCRQYWTDIRTDHQILKITSGQPHTAPADASDLHFERGNRLLATFGGLGRDFWQRILSLDHQMHDLFADNATATLLGRVQQDILDLEDPNQPMTALQARKSPEKRLASDDSIQIHICHSPMREIEVLRDQLLYLLSTHRELDPDDIMVMMPDIETYAPYVDAVFGQDGADNGRLPYGIADRPARIENHALDAFRYLLDMADGRLEASTVLRLLAFEPVREKFGLELSDLDRIDQWVLESQIQWGRDGRHRSTQDLPGFEQNTWRQGLDRLLLGVAIPEADPPDVFAGIMPIDAVEGQSAVVLGRFAHFAATLFEQIDALGTPTSAERWADRFQRLIGAMIDAGDRFARQVHTLRRLLSQLQSDAQLAGYKANLSFVLVRQWWRDHLEQHQTEGGFISGGITFCTMLPMRSIPSKVVCLVGLNHDRFPREDRQPSFNIISNNPRPGDRSSRLDDQYLFLEALISARKIFYISYIGRDIKDNTPIPPSVVVSELLDYLAYGYGVPGETIICQHPLQSFSPRLFDGSDPRMLSYSTDDLAASRRLRRPIEPRPFFSSDLPPPPESMRHVHIDDLQSFFSNPCRYLMNKRLGVYLAAEPSQIQDREAFTTEGLFRYQLKQRYLNGRINGLTPSQIYQHSLASGQLPHGSSGLVAHRQISLETEQFYRMVQQFTQSDAPSGVPLDIQAGSFQVRGELQQVFGRRHLRWRFGRLRAKDMIAAFVSHLAWCHAGGDHFNGTTWLIGQNLQYRFRPVDQPKRYLQQYLAYYWEGLPRPLPLFPESSLAFARQIYKDGQGGTDRARRAAKKQWTGNDYQPGESRDPYYDCCFRYHPALDEHFERCARNIIDPMLTFMEKAPMDLRAPQLEKRAGG